MASDSRTNAGVDYVTTFSKMHVYTPAPDRIFILLSAGNLATTQEVMNRIQRDLEHPSEVGSLLTARYMFEAADYVGKISLSVQRDHGPALQASGVNAETTLILGGQIQGQDPGLYMIYPQGNYFAATPETPYLQIGENKYGKPSVDRIVDTRMSLDDGARLLLVSLDATTRSNLTVGPPFELAICPRDAMQLSHYRKYEANDPYLQSVQQSWNQGIRNAFDGLPRFDWELLQAPAAGGETAAGAPAEATLKDQQPMAGTPAAPEPQQALSAETPADGGGQAQPVPGWTAGGQG
ncbi:putative proteasome-type protease [Thioalbus denitrificans]|uniref:Putative proteasome-type protease n=2 Tax=Thioalbus denitrificans TaxID=547122 RepID=A0A369C947_9GAMM|nr:putative proteasome-type protease [Thioalbus denitrificans]